MEREGEMMELAPGGVGVGGDVDGSVYGEADYGGVGVGVDDGVGIDTVVAVSAFMDSTKSMSP